MNTEKTFTIQDLIDFALSDNHTFSVWDAIRFVSQFLESQDEEMSESEKEELIAIWKERNGFK